MSTYRLKLRPGGIIPPAMGVGVVMRREVAAAVETAAPAAAAVTVGCEFGVGADMWADATEITFGELKDCRSAYTYVADYTGETGELRPYSMDFLNTGHTEYEGIRSAWWKILIPADKVVYCDADTKASFGYVDSQLAIWYMPGDGTAIGDLVGVAWDEDEPFNYLHSVLEPDYGSSEYPIPDTGGPYWSRLLNIKLDGSLSGNAEGTWFYFQTSDYADGLDPSAVVLRISVTETFPGSTPADGHDP